jgi:hypothetical protein
MRHEAAAHRMSAIIKSMADTQRTAGSWINPAMLASAWLVNGSQKQAATTTQQGR